MSDPRAVALAASRLAVRRFPGFGPFAPRSWDEAYLLQESGNARLRGRLGPVAGYKIGCTTSVMQRFLGIEEPCGGEVLQATVHAGSARIARSSLVRPGVECEIAVRLGRSLGPGDAPFSRDSVALAVDAVMASIELVDDRYVDYGMLDAFTLTSDDFFNAGCVLGDALTDWRALDLAALRGRMTIDGEVVGEGRGGDILGHPLDALAWLATSRAARDRELPAGSFVTLGSLVATKWIERGQEVVVAVEELGEVRLVLV